MSKTTTYLLNMNVQCNEENLIYVSCIYVIYFTTYIMYVNYTAIPYTLTSMATVGKLTQKYHSRQNLAFFSELVTVIQ